MVPTHLLCTSRVSPCVLSGCQTRRRPRGTRWCTRGETTATVSWGSATRRPGTSPQRSVSPLCIPTHFSLVCTRCPQAAQRRCTKMGTAPHAAQTAVHKDWDSTLAPRHTQGTVCCCPPPPPPVVSTCSGAHPAPLRRSCGCVRRSAQCCSEHPGCVVDVGQQRPGPDRPWAPTCSGAPGGTQVAGRGPAVGTCPAHVGSTAPPASASTGWAAFLCPPPPPKMPACNVLRALTSATRRDEAPPPPAPQ
jgi:hypothetical protein